MKHTSSGFGLKHGRPLYMAWMDMHRRCYNPRVRCYHRYGGRGIRVCKRWFELDNFILDMPPRPPGTSLDRINNNGDYEPGNCRWSSRIEQANNRRPNRLFTIDSKTQTLTQWCRELHIRSATVDGRLKRGWNVDRAFFVTPKPTRIYARHIKNTEVAS